MEYEQDYLKVQYFAEKRRQELLGKVNREIERESDDLEFGIWRRPRNRKGTNGARRCLEGATSY